MKTSERIVQNSLELFNQQGERSVSTNHIAAHMDMSPGNLYYHFPNKQAIIAVLFSEYENLVDSFLRPPQGRAATVEDKRFYLQELLAAMWRYRFLHRDLEHLLDSDPDLAARYRRFSQRSLIHGTAIYEGFVAAGILKMDRVQIESLTLNAWIILTSWVRFLCTTRENFSHLSEQAIKRGVYQVLVLEAGFVTDQAREEVDALFKEYYVPWPRPWRKGSRIDPRLSHRSSPCPLRNSSALKPSKSGDHSPGWSSSIAVLPWKTPITVSAVMPRVTSPMRRSRTLSAT